jgi:hypothetical protein
MFASLPKVSVTLTFSPLLNSSILLKIDSPAFHFSFYSNIPFFFGKAESSFMSMAHSQWLSLAFQGSIQDDFDVVPAPDRFFLILRCPIPNSRASMILSIFYGEGEPPFNGHLQVWVVHNLNFPR